MEPPLNSRHDLLRWTKNVLQEYGIRPYKKLSQNFVVEPRIIKDILSVVGSGNSIVLEIGAGLGTLTYYLAQENDYVIAVEIDERLVEILSRIAPWNTDIIVGDALKHFNTNYRGVIVSNAPYHISSLLIIGILHTRAHRAVLMLQKEVALRLVAKPGSSDYGRLSVITQYIADIQLITVYPPRCFYPSPEVASALVVLKRKRAWSNEAEIIENLTRCLFSEKNKLAVKVVKKCVPLIPKELLKDLGEKRVRDLSLNDILTISRYVKSTI